jgi:hypothetical protein
MSRICPPPGGSPRLGIFVDCKRFREKSLTGPPQSQPRMRAESTAWRPRHWQFGVMLAALGLIFLLAVTGSALSVLLPPERDRDPVIQALNQQNSQPIFAKAMSKAVIKPPAKIASVKITAVSEQGSIARDNPRSPEKIDPPVVEIIAAVEAPKSQAMEVSVKDDASCTSGVCSGSGDFCNTAVHFLASPKLAEEEAAKQHKLVFVLHVSGNFEDPGFT